MTAASLLQDHCDSGHTPGSDDNESAPACESNLSKHASSNAPSSSLSRLFRKSEYAPLQDHASGGKGLVQWLESIQLPFVKRIEHYHPGEEWIRGVLLCTWGAGAILFVNVVLTSIAAGIGYSKSSADTHFAYAELYQGDCSVAHGWSVGMHLVINALSTALLAASNYAMQCLNAPSRADVDKAHSQRKWLAIGAFSSRNFWVMDPKRKLLWSLLLISSLPIHMLYNSAIFSSITTIGYGTVLIPNDLGRNEPLVQDSYAAKAFHNATGFSPSQVQSEIFNGTFQNLSMPDCLQEYTVHYNTDWSTLLLVTERELASDGFSLRPMTPVNDEFYSASIGVGNWMSLVRRWERSQRREVERWEKEGCPIKAGHWSYAERYFRVNGSDAWMSLDEFISQPDSGSYTLDMAFKRWLDDLDTFATFVLRHSPNDEQLDEFLRTDSNCLNSSWAAQVTFRTAAPSGGDPFGCDSYDGCHTDLTPNITISHCMAKVADQKCQLYFSLPICLVVIGCNIVKIVCMFQAARTNHREILLTIGDSLSSFLDKPDVTTKGRGFLSRSQMTRGHRAWGSKTNGSSDTIPLNDISANRTVRHATYPELLPRKKRWGRAASWKRWTITLYFFLSYLAASYMLCWYAIGSEIGGRQSKAVIDNMGFGKPDSDHLIFPSENVLGLILLANAPQLVFSTLYFLCNSLFSCMLSAAEYNDFATQRKPLRVSWPKGLQRSTYYLSLPYRYSAPLITVSIVMHWLLSRSIFLVKVNALDVHGRQLHTLHELSTEYASVTACGHSPLAMLITAVIATAAMITMVAFAMRPLRSRMPLASYCSAAISASCHPPVDDTDASLKPVMWGEVPGDSTDGHNSSNTDQAMERGYAHCTFTSKDVDTPNAIRLYC